MKNLSEYINEELLLEMAQIGVLDNKYVIVVWTNDPGNIPHFHIMDKVTRGSNFHTCIKIESAEYFHHTGKEAKLNAKQKKELMKFLNDTDKWGENNWIVLLKEWDRNNSHTSININTPMPNYNEL